MNLHEFQSKEILQSFGVQIQRGIVAHTPEEAVVAAKKLYNEIGVNSWVIKAQIHAGGRGKAGGIQLAKSLDEVKNQSSRIIGMNLITPQTSPTGKKVYQVLIAEDLYYLKPYRELYISITLNRDLEKNMIIYSPKGGIDIEVVAKNTPEYIFTEIIDPIIGLQEFQVRKIAFNLGFSRGELFKQMIQFISTLYNAYINSDASLFEINPVLETSDKRIIAIDSKVILDDNALFKHKIYEKMRDTREEDPIEVEARQAGLNFIKLDGNVGCMVNGAGLAMATMDMIKLSGGAPANFLDIGGAADTKRVKMALQIILKDLNVKVILINIFGGIVRCDRVAQGLLDVYQNFRRRLHIPIIVRLEGTNSDIAKNMINTNNLQVHGVITLQEAAKKIKEVVQKNL